MLAKQTAMPQAFSAKPLIMAQFSGASQIAAAIWPYF
jgi:hypothetical protein